MNEWIMRPVRCTTGPLDTPCVLWTGAVSGKDYLKGGGYGSVRFQGRTTTVHRVAFYLAHGRWPNVCRHICDTRMCFNVLHLEDGTHADNMRDRAERNGNACVKRGEFNGATKLTDHDVRAILRLVAMGYPQKDVAIAYGVSKYAVSLMVCGKTWKHVTV